MEFQLKHLYGKRTTPGVKVLILVLIILLGLQMAFRKTNYSDKEHAPADTCIDIQSDDQELIRPEALFPL